MKHGIIIASLFVNLATHLKIAACWRVSFFVKGERRTCFLCYQGLFVLQLIFFFSLQWSTQTARCSIIKKKTISPEEDCAHHSGRNNAMSLCTYENNSIYLGLWSDGCALVTYRLYHVSPNENASAFSLKQFQFITVIIKTKT